MTENAIFRRVTGMEISSIFAFGKAKISGIRHHTQASLAILRSICIIILKIMLDYKIISNGTALTSIDGHEASVSVSFFPPGRSHSCYLIRWSVRLHYDEHPDYDNAEIAGKWYEDGTFNMDCWNAGSALEQVMEILSSRYE